MLKLFLILINIDIFAIIPDLTALPRLFWLKHRLTHQ